MAKSYLDYLKEILQSQKDVKDDQLSASNKAFEAEKEKLKKEYDQKIYEADRNYTQLVSKENVNKLINERKLNESMANKGLGDSGFGKTLNKNGNISHGIKLDKLKNSNRYQVGKLHEEMKDELEIIEAKRSEAESKIDESFLKNAEKTAQALYKADKKGSASGSGSSSRKQSVSLKEEKEPQSTNNGDNYEQFLFTAEQYKKIGMVVKEIIDRKTYNNERRLDKSLPSYDDYVKDILDYYVENENLGEDEYQYIIRKFNVKG